MAVQQRRVSKSRKNKRRSHHHLSLTMVSRCSHCDKFIKSHTVCPHCGYYRNKQIITIR